MGSTIIEAAPNVTSNLARLRSAVAHGDADEPALSHVQRFSHEHALRWVIRVLLLGELLGDRPEAVRRALGREDFRFTVRRLADPDGKNSG